MYHRPKPLPKGPSPGFLEFPRRTIPPTAKYTARKMTDREMAQYWYEKFEKKKLRINQLNAKISGLEDGYQEQHDRAEEEAAKYDHEKDKLERLLASHVRAINTVASGLEPVADQTFVEKFEKLHSEVSQWCRSGFKEGEDGYVSQSATYVGTYEQPVLQSRVNDIDFVRLPEIIDCMVWAFSEKLILSLSLPERACDVISFIAALESCIERGDNTPTHERTSIWRSQTFSLLFQDPEFQRCLKDVSFISSLLIVILSAVPRRPQLQEQFIGRVDGSLRSIQTLAVEMACQRGSFRLDESVAPGVSYDEETMQDIRFSGKEEGKEAVVVAVLSRGWIRTTPKEFGDVERLICKNRVVVKLVPKGDGNSRSPC